MSSIAAKIINPIYEVVCCLFMPWRWILENESNYRGADVGDGVWLVVEGVQRRFQQLSLSLDLAEVGHGSLISWTPPNC